MRRLTSREWALVSCRCCWRRFLYGARVVIAMWAWSAVSSCSSLPYASLRYWISFASLAVSSVAIVSAFPFVVDPPGFPGPVPGNPLGTTAGEPGGGHDRKQPAHPNHPRQDPGAGGGAR